MTVVKLPEAASKSSDSKLSFCLSKPYPSVVSQELRELEGYTCTPELVKAEAEDDVEGPVEDPVVDIVLKSEKKENTVELNETPLTYASLLKKQGDRGTFRQGRLRKSKLNSKSLSLNQSLLKLQKLQKSIQTCE